MFKQYLQKAKYSQEEDVFYTAIFQTNLQPGESNLTFQVRHVYAESRRSPQRHRFDEQRIRTILAGCNAELSDDGHLSVQALLQALLDQKSRRLLSRTREFREVISADSIYEEP